MMTATLRRLWIGLRLFYQMVKGHSRQYVSKEPSLVEDLIAYSMDGYEIRIYCQKQHYRRQYDRWFIPTEHQLGFRVYGVVTNDAPERLKTACDFDLEIAISQDHFKWGYRNKQYAIKVYLDKLIDRLEVTKTSH